VLRLDRSSARGSVKERRTKDADGRGELACMGVAGRVSPSARELNFTLVGLVSPRPMASGRLKIRLAHHYTAVQTSRRLFQGGCM